MPLLDMSDVLYDPDFLDINLSCARNLQVVGSNGVATDNITTLPFAATVTSFGGDELKRSADGEYITQTITLVTAFKLTDGKAFIDGRVYTADIITYRGSQYTVMHVDDYSAYGHGFIQATAELLPLAGRDD
jgi:hypothetical protein